MRLSKAPRAGVTAVESALVFPAVFLLLLGLAVGGAGMMRYQEMAALAREAARWASVHGRDYAKATGNPPATASDVYANSIAPNAYGLDPAQLLYTVAWDTDNGTYHTVIVNGDVVAVRNNVSVTVSYQWIPEAFLGGVTLTSTSVMPMSY
jgi:Flp pilus assembly protein TadG